MDEVIELRLKRLEMDITVHDKELKEQGNTLNKITQLLAQIRWMGVGALGFFVLNNIGLLAFVKKIFVL